VATPEPSCSTIPRAGDNWTQLQLLAQVVLILSLALTLNLAGNARTSLWDRDEPRYATCTREMRQSGDWIHPTFNAEPRYHKPILIYWLMLAGTALAGDNPFGARLVSALAGAASCLVVWVWGRRMFGPRIGLLSALVLTTAPIMVVESKLATTDATLAFLMVACQYALWELNRRDSRALATLFWVCLALATLTKGPIAAALIAVAGLFSWWASGQLDCWSRLRWRLGLALFAFITAPWFIAIGIASKGEFYRVAVGFHIVERVLSGIEEHGAFPGYYLVTTLLVFFPWAALLPVALVAAWRRRRENPDFAYLLGWIVGPMIFLECVRTKLVHYYLPAYPACSLLVAWSLAAIFRSEVNLRRWPAGRFSMGLLTGIGLAVAIAPLAASFILPAGLRWPCLALALVLGTGTLLAMEWFQNGRTDRAVLGLVVSTAAGLWLAVAWLLPSAEPYRISRIVGERLSELCRTTQARPILGQFQEPGVIYAMGRPAGVMRTRPELVQDVRREGVVVSALVPAELSALKSDERLTVDVRDTLRAFNISKGYTETVHLVLIKPAELAGGGVQKPGVK
jgi:4-amino-4-deoxy-L-arabinose transferase-like glycosyltransferase